MKSIIFPTDKFEYLKTLTTHVPEYLLPIVNKPIVEHLVELLVRNGIKDIVIMTWHMPVEVEEYFGNGERWGAHITYLHEQEYRSIGLDSGRICSDQNESFICLSGNIVTNLDVSDLIESHKNSRADMTISLQSTADSTPVSALSGKGESANDFSPFVITSEILSQILLDGKEPDIKHVVAALSEKDLIVNIHSSPYDFISIRSVDDYWVSNKLILNGMFSGIIIPGKQRQEGVWVGKYSKIHPNVKLMSPLLIGDCCDIRKGASVGKDTIVGNNVLVDHDACVGESVILGKTYVGPNTEIKESVAWKKFLINVPRISKTFVTDDFILGDMERRTMVPAARNILSKVAAFSILTLFSPIVLLFYLYHLILPSKGFFVSEERFSSFEQFDHDGNERLCPFNLYSFKCRNRFMKTLPGMLNVIKGDLRLSGKPPLSRTEIDLCVNIHGSPGSEEPFGLYNFRKGAIGEKSVCRKEPVRNNINRHSLWKNVKVALNSLV